MKIAAVTLLTASLVLGSLEQAEAKKKSQSQKGTTAPVSTMSKASAGEIAKLKGGFKWGMRPEEVMAVAQGGLEAKYEERLKKATQDPSKQARIRREMAGELELLKKSHIRFEGEKTGLDVSIIGQEIAHKSSESVLSTKEEMWTRYFFFFEDRLYKMFIGFNKDALQGKTFDEFGQLMGAKYGKGLPVYREEKTKGGSEKVLDHYAWNFSNGDALRLVDRSAFYDVFCLVIFDAKVADRVAERRKLVGPKGDQKHALVESVTTTGGSTQDANEDVVDRITGRATKPTGPRDVVVEKVPASAPSSPPPADPAAAPEPQVEEKSSAKSKSKGKGVKSSAPDLGGLEL